ncbi:MAG: hypothetical protein ACP5E3_08280 [Bacteroidales bacterium]
MRYLKAIILILSITSCGISFSDINLNLGDGYYFLGEGRSQSYIYSTYNIEKPAIDEIVIWPTVISYDFDGNFIIVKQSPNRDVISQNLTYFRDISEIKADSIILTDTSFVKMLTYDTCYWIIDKKDKILNGPFDLSDFIKKKKSLGVSKRLNLK